MKITIELHDEGESIRVTNVIEDFDMSLVLPALDAICKVERSIQDLLLTKCREVLGDD